MTPSVASLYAAVYELFGPVGTDFRVFVAGAAADFPVVAPGVSNFGVEMVMVVAEGFLATVGAV